MASHHEVAARYWGYLIQHDKKPSPILQQLLLGLAKYIRKHVAPWDIDCLTPPKLATFYRLVGGDYDPLFLDTPDSSLSFIYQSLGCFHTLQPSKDPYTPPTVPALTARGFVKWQTMQLLLDPEEHAPFLQEAVKRFDLINSQDGEPFPSILPRESLPMKPDKAMLDWHDLVSDKLMLEAKASRERTKIPPRPPLALSDVDADSSRPTSADSHSIESQSLVDAASYRQQPQKSSFMNGGPPPVINVHPPPRSNPVTTNGVPYSSLPRRSSFPPQHTREANRSAPPRNPYHPPTPFRPKVHVRSPSTISTSSCSSDTSSVSTSTASHSPVQYYSQLANDPRPPPASRRSSVGIHLQRAYSQPNVPSQIQNGGRSPGMVPNARGLNVRWQDPPPKSAWSQPTKPILGWIPPPTQSGTRQSSTPELNRTRSVGSRPASGYYPPATHAGVSSKNHGNDTARR